MKGKNLVAGLAALVLGVWASLQFAQTMTWYKYGPAPRYQDSVVYDSTSNIMVMFGGQHSNTSSGADYNDVWWALNLVNAACEPPCDLQWTYPAGLKVTPKPRFGHTAVYDAANQHMTIFAGAEGIKTPGPCENDVWVFSNATGVGGTPAWTQLSPSGGPPGVRYSHTAVYDSSSNRMVVFGGNNCSTTYYNDVWVLTNADGTGGTPAWSQLSPTGTAPATRAFSTAVYDAADNRMIIFGGYSGSYLGDVWVLTNANGLGGTPAWIQLNPSPGPAARYGHTAVYDSADNLMIVYAGSTSQTAYNSDTWILSNASGLGGTPVWTLNANTANATPRTLHSAFYNAASNQMFIFGGRIPYNIIYNPDDHIFVLNNANGL